MTFAELLTPLTLQSFLERYWGNHFLRLEGVPQRFGDLVSWASLNDVLGTTPVVEHMNVVRKGGTTPSSQYLRPALTPHGPRLVNRRALERRLRGGDTLVVNAAGEFFPRIREIQESLERTFGLSAGANLYAGFRRVNGFELHWDAHDTLILQIHGAKMWRVYNPTKLNPVSQRRPQDMVRPSERPVWEGLLNDGDLLYMPRGWWHVAEPVDGASLHVTFSVCQPTGIQLLCWIVDNLKDIDVVRQNLPVVGGVEARRSLAAQLVQVMSEHLTEDAITQYFAWSCSHTGRGLKVALPEATRDRPVGSHTPLVLTEARNLTIEEVAGGQGAFWAAGRLWMVDSAFEPALACLDDERGHSTEELTLKVSSDARPRFRLLLTALVEGGVLAPIAAQMRVEAPHR